MFQANTKVRLRLLKKGKRVTVAQNKKKKKISLRKAILREISRAIG